MEDDSNKTSSNVYEGGKGDARQLEQSAIPDDCKLFRKRYRQLSAPEIALHDAIKDKADELAALFAQVKLSPQPPPHAPPGRPEPEARLYGIANNQGANVTLALRHLEDAVYRAVKALTA